MRVYVYAISKNEEKHVARWMDGVSEADGVYVLDTGSTDETVSLLRQRGAQVLRKEISPWRFDTARNESLALVPQDGDICLCVDLDEVLSSGWRAQMEAHWPAGEYVRGRYWYVWSHDANGGDGIAFYSDKAHSRHGFAWQGAVHEVLVCEKTPITVEIPGMRLDHWPDAAKSRAQYLELLELAVAENPENDRNAHYLGREYYFHGEYARAIAQLKRHLGLKNATWPDERCASMRYIARCYEATGRMDEAEKWLLRAVAEAPHLREPWLDIAKIAYARAEWEGVLFACKRLLRIGERPRTYISEPECWGEMPYDFLTIANYRLGRLSQALENCQTALQLKPDSERIRANFALLQGLDRSELHVVS